MKLCKCGKPCWAKGLCRNCYNKKWRRENPQHAREMDRVRNLRRWFDLTLEQYDQILAEQGGVCAGCGRPPRKTRLAVDHNHATDIVRGLLCRGCNIALGGVEDNPQTLLRLIQYLARRTHVVN
jgi:Recombination endonuclease VII